MDSSIGFIQGMSRTAAFPENPKGALSNSRSACSKFGKKVIALALVCSAISMIFTAIVDGFMNKNNQNKGGVKGFERDRRH